MSINVIVAPEFARRVVQRELRETAQRVLNAEQVGKDLDLSIVVVGDRVMRQYNRRFHHVDARTDVLSFPSSEKNNLGDIIVSYETAQVNARAAAWHVRNELNLLVVHGMLHLLGYDDSTPRRRARMWRRQAEILNAP